MTTQIKPVYDKEHLLKWFNFETTTFYCKEDSKTVLKELFSKYHVSQYNNIYCLDNPIRVFTSKGRSPLYYHGISIEPLSISIEVEKSWKDFNYDLPKKTLVDYTLVIADLIEKYLVKTMIIEQPKFVSGSKIGNSYAPAIVIPAVKKFTNYMETRTTNPQEDKELQLEDILTYGKVALGDSFDIGDINKIINKMEKDYGWIKSDLN